MRPQGVPRQKRRRRRTEPDSFYCEQPGLGRHPARSGESSGPAARGHNPVARNNKGDGILGKRPADGAGRVWLTDGFGKITVRSGLPREDLAGGLVHPPRKLASSAQVNRDPPEILKLTSKVSLYPFDQCSKLGRDLS